MIKRIVSLFLFLMFCKPIMGSNVTIYPNDVPMHTNIWNAVHDFGNYHNVKEWALHFQRQDGSKWRQLMRAIIKQNGTAGYFSSQEIPLTQLSSDKNSQASKNILILHFLTYQDLHKLKEIFEARAVDSLNQKCEGKLNQILSPKSNIWLILMPNNAKTNKIGELLNGIDLKYDTNSFCLTFDMSNVGYIYDAYKIHQTGNIILNQLKSYIDPQYRSIKHPNLTNHPITLCSTIIAGDAELKRFEPGYLVATVIVGGFTPKSCFCIKSSSGYLS